MCNTKFTLILPPAKVCILFGKYDYIEVTQYCAVLFPKPQKARIKCFENDNKYLKEQPCNFEGGGYGLGFFLSQTFVSFSTLLFFFFLNCEVWENRDSE